MHRARTAMLLACAIAHMGMAASAGESPQPPVGMAFIRGGSYKPLYAKQSKPRTVEPFFMDVVQVTNAQFLEFVKQHPEWRRSKVPRTLADVNYLKHWTGDLELGGSAPPDVPV